MGLENRFSPVLLLGDTLAFLAFAALGRGSHQETTGVGTLGAMRDMVVTAVPFLLAWYIVATPLGALSPKLLGHTMPLIVSTMRSWLLAWPCSLLLRAVWLQRSVPVSFAVVVLIANAFLLLGWRSVVSVVVERLPRDSH